MERITFIEEEKWIIEKALDHVIWVFEHHLDEWCPDASPEDRTAALHSAYDGTVEIHPVLHQMLNRMEREAREPTGSYRHMRRTVYRGRAAFCEKTRHLLRVANTRLPFLHDVIKLQRQITWRETFEWYCAACDKLRMSVEYADHDQLRKKYHRWRN